MLDPDYPSEISREQVTPAMMGHFNGNSERRIVRFLFGLDGRKITGNEELLIELGYNPQYPATVKNIRRKSVAKLREIISAMEATGASPGQVRLSWELRTRYGIIVAPKSFTDELLQECFQEYSRELDLLDRLYLGSSGQPTVQMFELKEEFGKSKSALKDSALARLRDQIVAHGLGRYAQREQPEAGTKKEGNTTGSDSDQGDIFGLSMEMLRMVIIEPKLRIRRLERELQDLREEVVRLRAQMAGGQQKSE